MGQETAMYVRRGRGEHVVTLPDGTRMTAADLPPDDTRRWVASRKRAVVHGVRTGLLSLDEAIKRYDLSEEEFAAWETAEARYGLRGLKTTLTQELRLR
jgi:hypothetical protein